MLGILTAYLLTFLNFKDESTDAIADTKRLTFVHIILSIIMFIIFQFSMREKPPTAPSAAAEAKLKPAEFGELFKEIKQNRSFTILLITKCINYGS